MISLNFQNIAEVVLCQITRTFIYSGFRRGVYAFHKEFEARQQINN